MFIVYAVDYTSLESSTNGHGMKQTIYMFIFFSHAKFFFLHQTFTPIE